MNIDFNAAFKAGMSEEEIRASIDKAIDNARKEAEQELLKAKKEQEKEVTDKDMRKAEARAYMINAIIAYSEAFDMEEEFDQDDINKLEELLIKVEDMIPMYMQLMEKYEELGDLGLSFGLGGFNI